MNPVEVQARQYYIHDSYIPVYYYVYEALEKWLANTVFREDRSRIILSSNEFALSVACIRLGNGKISTAAMIINKIGTPLKQ